MCLQETRERAPSGQCEEAIKEAIRKRAEYGSFYRATRIRKIHRAVEKAAAPSHPRSSVSLSLGRILPSPGRDRGQAQKRCTAVLECPEYGVAQPVFSLAERR